MNRITHNCYAWKIKRTDGRQFGFTDHDNNLIFEDITFKPTSGLSSTSVAKTTGLSVDTVDVMGGLSDEAITEDDIDAGKFDNATVTCWRVNWSDPKDRDIEFHGLVGEIRRQGSAFQAEIRGLSALLNKPMGRVFQSPCSAILGDKRCKMKLLQMPYSQRVIVDEVLDNKTFVIKGSLSQEGGWFLQGALSVLSGAGVGLKGMIKDDIKRVAERRITIWNSLPKAVSPGDEIELSAGCDKQFLTCQSKFSNTLNFRGFPDIPNDQWVMQRPEQFQKRDGSSRRTW